MYKVTGDDDDDEAAIESHRQHILRLNNTLVRRRRGSVRLSDRGAAAGRKQEEWKTSERWSDHGAMESERLDDSLDSTSLLQTNCRSCKHQPTASQRPRADARTDARTDGRTDERMVGRVS